MATVISPDVHRPERIPPRQALTRKWYAPVPVTAEAASRLADAYVQLMDRLAADAAVGPLFDELREARATAQPVPDP